MRFFQITGWCCCLLLWLSACKKEVDMGWEQQQAAAQINFYNASYALIGQSTVNPRGNMILVDSRDTTYTPRIDMQDAKYPYFWNPVNYGYAYPLAMRTQWISYMRFTAGTHRLYLLDTSKTILDSSAVQLSNDRAATVFYADSLGSYRMLMVNDAFTPADGKIGLRIVNLNPTDGDVFITINKTIPAALPASTHYGDHTPFIPLDITRMDTLKVKVYQPGDTSHFLARTSVEVVPGHAYTLVISGYGSGAPASYKDRASGRTVGISSNFSIAPIKNF
ncbi:DUF4397 domain-containing protein [Chitinophaga vietnamensis]|uniref:DUF4397 domain-containing protein n=1 Tax=Chitinophaga vietnamensis TaxID=2593957 RepID=UPI00137552E9|nr:DUF4397 domain-containing protein [Chitinophaga vietnamensis]